MNCRQRFQNVMNFQPVDKIPLCEIATWWDITIDKWTRQGFPDNLEFPDGITEYFGLDVFKQWWLAPYKSDFPRAEGHGKGVIPDLDTYYRTKKQLYPKDAIDKADVERWAKKQEKGEIVIWITFEGFFWVPRELIGVEEQLYAFYDHPKLIHTINQDLLEYNMQLLDEFCKICKPDFMTFAEDMSYKSGSMISKELFDEFMAPYYKQIVPQLKHYGTIPFLDSDGNIEQLVPWYKEVGIDAFLPLERQAGLDLAALREKHPSVRLIGGYDKMVMAKGEAAMRAEFERLLPVMQQGGYVPSVDHQTPPAVTLENYYVYLKLLNEYCSGIGS
ncbi:MAG: hypothetical protein GXO75_11280 [Calditrichaeota bacterium]|nr:hypothetical protein [Calditrichota bacterium]